MMNICFLGLSGSGKTCYLYAASHVLTEGIQTTNGSVSIVPTNENRSAILNNGIKYMENGEHSVWPKGSDQTMEFPFELFLNGKSIRKFKIYDYRGGALSDASDQAQDDRQELYDKLKESSCVVVFIDAYILMKAFSLKNGDDEAVAYERGNLNMETETITKARAELNHIKVIINNVRGHIGNNIPILLTITKKDILSDSELVKAMDELKKNMDILFSDESPNPVGITSVSLGNNLGKGEPNADMYSKLTGCLCLDVSQNLHIPILFPLFLGIELSPNDIEIAKKIFTNNVLQMYIGGQRAILTF